MHYDSFGNLKYYYDNTAYNTFTYDDQNRVTAAYGKNYSYDTVGRMSSYEGTSQTVNNSFPLHAIKKTGYSYDANGNLVSRAGGQTLTWNPEHQRQRHRGPEILCLRQAARHRPRGDGSQVHRPETGWHGVAIF